MSKHEKIRLLIVLLLALVVLSIMFFSVFPGNRINTMSAPLTVITRPIESVFSNIKEHISCFFKAVDSNRRLTKENQVLREKNLALRIQIKDNEQAAQAYEELKQAFSLKDRFPEQKFLAGNILQRPLETDYDCYRLDVGSGDGLDFTNRQGYAVVEENTYLAGSLVKADRYSAKVLPITHPGFSCSVSLANETGKAFILRGQGEDEENTVLLAVDIPNDLSITVGDKIYSSGLGGIFPRGLLCGEVSKIYPEDEAGHRRAEVKPVVDLHDSNVLFVLLPREDEVGEELSDES